MDRATKFGMSEEKYVVDCAEAEATKWSGSRKELLKARSGRSDKQSCSGTRMCGCVEHYMQSRDKMDRRLNSPYEPLSVPMRAHTKVRVGAMNQFTFDFEEKIDKFGKCRTRCTKKGRCAATMPTRVDVVPRLGAPVDEGVDETCRRVCHT